MSNSNNLLITHIEQNQSQKEVTINEAINRIESILNIGAIDKGINTPPSSPNNGDLYIIGSSPTDEWSDNSQNIAYYDSGWKFIIPNEGMTIWVNDEDLHYSWNGTNWIIGSNDTIQSNLITFDTLSGDVQVKINKDTSSDKASFLFQTGFSSRAEFGTISDDNFQIKVSPDGSTFYQSVILDSNNGNIVFKNDISVEGVLKDTKIKSYSEVISYNSTANGSVIIDFNNANIHELTLTGNITSLIIDNPPTSANVGNITIIIKQDAIGGRTISWPSSFKWSGGEEPSLTTDAHSIDTVNIYTTDGGSNYYATSALDFK